jgi:hypothetical protein
MFLLDDLLIKLPMKGLLSIAKTIDDMAQNELTNVDKIKEDLMHLQMQFETDQISEEEFEQKEAELLERLNLARERQEQ